MLVIGNVNRPKSLQNSFLISVFRFTVNINNIITINNPNCYNKYYMVVNVSYNTFTSEWIITEVCGKNIMLNMNFLFKYGD